MVDIKLNPQHGSMEHRIDKRLRNSGAGAGNPGHVVVTKGTGPTRTHTNIHNAAGIVPPPKLKDDRQQGGGR